MTTPTDGEWMSAYEALQFLQLPDAEGTICRRAFAGLIKARAKLLIFQDKEEADVEVPREFWWAKGGDPLAQNWASGDFETTFDDRRRFEAFGVQFRRSDIEQLKPAIAARPTAPFSPTQKRAGRTVFIGHGRSRDGLN